MKRTKGLLRASAAARRCIASTWFWRVSIGLFSLQAVYIASVGRYSMAFDEYYHFGAIQAYAKVLFPWQVRQPEGSAIYGALTVDPSYLYHYLMSWPYRIIRVLTENQTTQIIALRLIDVLIVVVALYVFRKLLLELGMSRWAVHLALFFIMVLPVTSFLAGQLVYDTLFFLMSGITLYAMLRLLGRIQAGHTLPFVGTILTLALLLLTAQVKYAFLPIAVMSGIFFLVVLVSRVRRKQLSVTATLREWRTAAATWLGAASVLLLLVSGVFFGMRYGSNIVSYHNPVPACDSVLSHEDCLAFGPYQRDDINKQNQYDESLSKGDKLTYPAAWLNQMIRETYFAVGSLEIGYPTGAPLPISYVVGYAIALTTLLVLVVRIRYLWRFGMAERLLLVCLIAYGAALLLMNYQSYLNTGAPVAIHGRYLLPLFPVMAYLAYRGLHGWVFSPRAKAIATLLSVALAVLSAYGGGIAPFVLRSDSSWYFPGAVHTSQTVRTVLNPIVWR